MSDVKFRNTGYALNMIVEDSFTGVRVVQEPWNGKLSVGDIITHINGKIIGNLDDFASIIEETIDRDIVVSVAELGMKSPELPEFPEFDEPPVSATGFVVALTCPCTIQTFRITAVDLNVEYWDLKPLLKHNRIAHETNFESFKMRSDQFGTDTVDNHDGDTTTWNITSAVEEGSALTSVFKDPPVHTTYDKIRIKIVAKRTGGTAATKIHIKTLVNDVAIEKPGGGTEYVQALSDSYVVYSFDYVAGDPVTQGTWTQSDIESLKVNHWVPSVDFDATSVDVTAEEGHAYPVLVEVLTPNEAQVTEWTGDDGDIDEGVDTHDDGATVMEVIDPTAANEIILGFSNTKSGKKYDKVTIRIAAQMIEECSCADDLNVELRIDDAQVGDIQNLVFPFGSYSVKEASWVAVEGSPWTTTQINTAEIVIVSSL